MKKLFFVFFALILAGSLLFVACKKDNEEEPPLVFSFTLLTTPGYTYTDVVLQTGEQFKVGILSNAATGATLSRFLVTRIYNEKPDSIFDSILSSATFSFDYTNITISEPGTETWKFTIWQGTGDSISHSFVITAESTVGPINAFNQVIMGAQINNIGGFCATSDASVLDLITAKANSGKIDLVYFFSQETFATIASPDNDIAAHIYTDGGTYDNPGPNALLTWPTRNASRFRLITDSIDWDAIVDDSKLIQYTQGAVASQAEDLKSGNYVSFITQSGKKGLARINHVFQEEDGTIDISIKVQQ